MAKRIMVIDDEPDMVEVTKARLEKSGYESIVATSVEEAFALMEKGFPDLILLDMLLPKMQGEDVCIKIKSDPKLTRLPVILFTASVGDMPNVTKAVGADDFIMKPFEAEDLLDKIEKLLN